MERKTEIEESELERKTEMEESVLEISAAELIENLRANRYRENPDVLQNLRIHFTETNAYIEFEKILASLQNKGLSTQLRKLASRAQLGQLPSDIGQLTALTSLDVKDSHLTTLAGIESLGGLTSLNVSSNRLTTLAGIEWLSALTSLDVGHNWLTTFAGIEYLTALRSLNVSSLNTDLLGVSEIKLRTLAGISQLTALTSLNLAHNGLTTLAGMKSLGGLTSLDVRYNPLTTLAGIGSLTGLTSLDLTCTQLATLAGIECLSALTSLDVKNNHLTTLAGIESLRGRLTSLNVKNNHLTTLAGIESLRGRLTSLNVINNHQLRTLAGIGSLTALTELIVGGNQLTTLERIGSLTGLTSLTVCDAQLTTLERIGSLTGLTSLTVCRTPLATLAGIDWLSALISLDVSSNQLTTLAGVEWLNALTSLDVSNNQLTTLADIEWLSALTSLDVSDNQLTTLAGVESLTALTWLNVKDNWLTTLAGIGSLTALTKLSVRRNQLTRLPITLLQCAALENLKFKGNPLQAGTPSTIVELKAQFVRLRQAYRRLTEISDLMNDTVPMLSSGPNQIIVGYDDETSDRLELESLSPEESTLLKKGILSTQTKETQTQKKIEDLKVITDLHEAIKNNDIEEFQRRLSEAQNPSINLNTKIGEAHDTLLHTATFNNAPKFTQLLLEKGANPNQRNRNGYTPVDLAAVRGNHDILAVYQQHAAQPEQRSFVPVMPETWKMAAIKYRTIQGENPNSEMNHKEVKDILEAMLKNLEISLGQPNRNVNVQLQLFSYIRDKDAVNFKKLLEDHPGVNVDVPVAGTRLLNAATAQNDEAIVKLLLQASADPNQTTADGEGQAITPVHIAADSNLQNMLVLYKASRKVTEDTWTEAHRVAEIKRNSSIKRLFDAITHNHVEVFKDILSKNPGLDVNATDFGHPSLLHAAARRGISLEFTRQLLALGANPNTKMTCGKGPAARVLTPVGVAASEGRADLIELYMAEEMRVEESTWQGVRFGGPYLPTNTGPDADYAEAAGLVAAAWTSIGAKRARSSSASTTDTFAPKKRRAV